MDVSNAAALLKSKSRYAAAQAQLKALQSSYIRQKTVTMRYKAT
jgi:hypothetical protein